MNFLGLPAPGPSTRLLLAGAGEAAEAIRRASSGLDPYVPRWDRDFLELGAADSRGALGGARLLLEPVPLEGPQVWIGAGLEPARPGTAWYVGARRYRREERDRARREQRLLPLPEVGLEVALRTALMEIGERPFHLVLDLDVLDPAWAPAVARPCGLGADPRELWAALEVLRDRAPASFQVRGLVPETDRDGRTALLAAEIVRDLALLAWGR